MSLHVHLDGSSLEIFTNSFVVGWLSLIRGNGLH
jgi:hypothetical protein